MRGQLSAEMLIMIVVILAIVGIAATQLTGAAKEAGKGISNQSERISGMMAQAVKGERGEYCIYDEDCIDGRCQGHRCS